MHIIITENAKKAYEDLLNMPENKGKVMRLRAVGFG